MIKFLLSSVCLTVVGTVCSVCAVAQTKSFDDSEFEKQLIESSIPKKTSYLKQAPKAKEVDVPVTMSEYKKNLLDALLYHNLMNSISSLNEQIEPFRLAVLDKEVTDQKVKDFDSCNVHFFSPYFADAKALWSKLKSETDDAIEDYNLNVLAKSQKIADRDAAVLSASSDTQRQTQMINGRKRFVASSAQETLEEKKKTVVFTAGAMAETKKMEEQYGLDISSAPNVTASIRQESSAETANAEQTWENNDGFSIKSDAPEIDITMSVLNRFYPYQDSWGKRKSVSTSSLPLWTDQKHLYNTKIWRPKYDAIKYHCQNRKHPIYVSEPNVSDKIKYDYYFYDQVKQAHNAFVRETEAKGCLLTAEMKKAPERAPRPLPMIEEHIMVITGASGNLEQIYPHNPKNPSDTVGAFKTDTLWEAYKADGYQSIASEGEFNRYFSVYKKTITPRSAIKNIDGNRW